MKEIDTRTLAEFGSMNSTGGCWGSSYYRPPQLLLLFLLRVFDTCLSGNRFSRRRHLSPPPLPSHPVHPSNAMQQVTCKRKREREKKVELIIRIETYNLGAPLSPYSLSLSSTRLLLDGAFSFWIPPYTALYLLLYCMHILCIFYLETLVVLSRLFITVFNRNLLQPSPPPYTRATSWACFVFFPSEDEG